MEIRLELRWKAININRNVAANMMIHIHISNAIRTRQHVHRLLAATPSESDLKQTDAARQPVPKTLYGRSKFR